MNRSSVALLALVLLLCACTPQQALIAALVPQGAASTLLGHLQGVGEDNRKRIAELDTAGKWDELARFADKNLERDRSNADWWIVKGYALTQAGDHRAAVQAYGEAVRLEPDSAMAWNQLAQSHRASGDPQRAIVVLERAALAVRDSPTTAFLLGESYSDIRRFDDAAAAYRQALGLDPNLAPAWYGLSRAYTRMGREREALEARERLRTLDPKLAQRLEAETAAGTELR
jgi:tetratricopeptide (TPR) repeat protein